MRITTTMMMINPIATTSNPLRNFYRKERQKPPQRHLPRNHHKNAMEGKQMTKSRKRKRKRSFWMTMMTRRRMHPKHSMTTKNNLRKGVLPDENPEERPITRKSRTMKISSRIPKRKMNPKIRKKQSPTRKKKGPPNQRRHPASARPLHRDPRVQPPRRNPLSDHALLAQEQKRRMQAQKRKRQRLSASWNVRAHLLRGQRVPFVDATRKNLQQKNLERSKF